MPANLTTTRCITLAAYARSDTFLRNLAIADGDRSHSKFRCSGVEGRTTSYTAASCNGRAGIARRVSRGFHVIAPGRARRKQERYSTGDMYNQLC